MLRFLRHPGVWQVPLLLMLWWYGGQEGYALWQAFKNPAFLPVGRVVVRARDGLVEPADVQALVRSELNHNFLSIHPSHIERKLLQLPWVQAVSIRRVWPNRLDIFIKERTPIARWGKDGLIDHSFQTFYPAVSTLPEQLVELNGPLGSEEEVYNQYVQLQHLLQPLSLSINLLNLNSRGSWQLTLNSGLIVIVGRKDPLFRWARFIAWYPELQKHGQKMTQVDLRYPNGFSITSS
ncbi:MAG TPA: cell division protein FtsQ/DivIB [Coxiellaceae bacterium]|nr:cell division protein FtsQ/DivIB [Coxiellaceae bacterium]